MTKFRFVINETDPKNAYQLVRKAIIGTYARVERKLKGHPPRSLFFDKLNISLVQNETGSVVNGTIKTSFLRDILMVYLIIFPAFGFILYGLIGALLFPLIVTPFFVPLGYIAYRREKSAGNRLCKKLNGSEYQEYQ